MWQTDELSPTLSNILGASIWVALTSIIILEGVVTVVVLFAPPLIKRWKDMGRAEGLEEGLEKGREEARQQYEPQLEAAQARIAELEAQVRASNADESDIV